MRLIDKDVLVDKLPHNLDLWMEVIGVVKTIRSCPTVEPEPEHGEWVYSARNIPHCSQCGKEPKEISPYCPHCGARMEVEDA